VGFRWDSQYFCFNVMPFGMESAPRFTKIVTVLARSWRADGIRVLAYLDDWLFFVHPSIAAKLRDSRLIQLKPHPT
jgi:hypothetical protein